MLAICKNTCSKIDNGYANNFAIGLQKKEKKMVINPAITKIPIIGEASKFEIGKVSERVW